MKLRHPLRDALGTLVAAGLLLGPVAIIGYNCYHDATTTTRCEKAHELVDAWETVLDVPDNVLDMEPAEVLRLYDQIEAANPQGYSEWQQALENVSWACIEEEGDYDGEPTGP